MPLARKGVRPDRNTSAALLAVSSAGPGPVQIERGRNGRTSNVMLAPEGFVYDQLKTTGKRRLQFHDHLANLLAEVQQHKDICACEADSQTSARRLNAQAHRVAQLRKECTATANQIEAVKAAILDDKEEHQEEMVRLGLCELELELPHRHWMEEVYGPVMIEGW